MLTVESTEVDGCTYFNYSPPLSPTYSNSSGSCSGSSSESGSPYGSPSASEHGFLHHQYQPYQPCTPVLAVQPVEVVYLAYPVAVRPLTPVILPNPMYLENTVQAQPVSNHLDVNHFMALAKALQEAKLAEQSTEQIFYQYLRKRRMAKMEELKLNSYPLWSSLYKTTAEIATPLRDLGKDKKHWAEDHDFDRTCVRCGAEYSIFARRPAACRYHPQRMAFDIDYCEQRFQCCSGAWNSVGCSASVCHVSDTLRRSELNTFVEAPDAVGRDSRSQKVYALDCEMVYTELGPAVARVTLVDVDEEVVLDVFVRPQFPVVDYNTRFSGITEEMLEDGAVSLVEAQQMLFSLVNKETILLGHSLESDLKAMRIVHHSIVDTSIVFPHNHGLPLKRALRQIVLEELDIVIQAGVGGHDSAVDAASCMQLLKKKAKRKGIKF